MPISRRLRPRSYPFVEEQTIEKNGKVGKVSYPIDIRYPRFAGNTADFTVINRSFAEAAAKAARETTPTADAGVDREQEWSAEQGYSLYRPDAHAITVALTFWGYTGGAHGYGSTTCRLVDLRTGKAVASRGRVRAGRAMAEGGRRDPHAPISRSNSSRTPASTML